jgi:hypothetical protein
MIRMWSGMTGMSSMVVIVMWDRDGRWWVVGKWWWIRQTGDWLGRMVESPSLVLVINDTKLLMPLCQVN